MVPITKNKLIFTNEVINKKKLQQIHSVNIEQVLAVSSQVSRRHRVDVSVVQNKAPKVTKQALVPAAPRGHANTTMPRDLWRPGHL